MFRFFSRIVLISFLAFAAFPGYAEDVAPANRVKLLEGSWIPPGSMMTMGAEGKVAKLELSAGATLKFPARAVVDQLTFADKCTLIMLTDDTVTTTTDGVTAKDSKDAVWVSQPMNLEGKTVYGFVKQK